MHRVRAILRLRPGLLIVSGVLLAACSTSLEPAALEAAQGRWRGVATAVTEVGANGNPCVGLAGEFELRGSRIAGRATADSGAVFGISAFVTPAGAVEGGFAISGDIVVTWSGQLSQDGLFASGEWTDIERCRGTWSAEKQGVTRA